MNKCVIVREDEKDLVDLIRDLLEDEGYEVVPVLTVQDLLLEAALRTPCMALVDGTNPSAFDLWWVGPELARLGVPPVVFTAHSSARDEFAKDQHGYIGIVPKPFDADEFVNLVNGICLEENHATASSH